MELRDVSGTPDFAQIVELIRAEWPTEFGEADDQAMIRAMCDSYNSDTDTTKHLYDGDRIVGFSRYSLWPRDEASPTQAHVLDIALLPEYQRRGLGTLLMNHLIDDCRAKGLTQLLSRTFRTNNGSIRLHQSLGFTVFTETEDSIVWNLDLSRATPE